jgi:hypothetical protein
MARRIGPLWIGGTVIAAQMADLALSSSVVSPDELGGILTRLLEAAQFVNQVDPTGEQRLCVTLTTSDPELLAVLESARRLRDGKHRKVMSLLEQVASSTQRGQPITNLDSGHDSG